MKYVLPIILMFLIGCEEKADEGAKDIPSDAPNLIGLLPQTLDDLYLDYEPYETECVNNDHNCIEQDYIHTVDTFEMCEAIATWDHASGKMFIIEDPGLYAGNPDMMVFYDDPASPYNGTDEWGITGRNGTGHSDSAWAPPGMVYNSSETLVLGDCTIELINLGGGVGSVPNRASYLGIEFLNNQTLIYNQ